MTCYQCGCYSCSCSSSCTSCTCVSNDNGYSVSGVVSVQSSFNVPACDATATISVTKLKNALVGGYIWNPTYGYFKITSFDATAEQMVIENECAYGNAAAGTVVPALTYFQITDSIGPSWLADWVDYASVAADITASGGMVVSGITIDTAVYKQIGTMCFFNVAASFTLGTAQGYYIYVPLPVDAAALSNDRFSVAGINGDGSGPLNISTAINPTVDVVQVNYALSHLGPSLWVLGSDAYVAISGFYRTAS